MHCCTATGLCGKQPLLSDISQQHDSGGWVCLKQKEAGGVGRMVCGGPVVVDVHSAPHRSGDASPFSFPLREWKTEKLENWIK